MPALRSKIFQNFRLSSAAVVASIWPSGLIAAVEHTSLVSGDLNVANQSRIAPDAERVVGEATGADDLAVVVAPAQGRDLGAGVDAVDTSTGGGVPEVNVTIVRTTAGGEKV